MVSCGCILGLYILSLSLKFCSLLVFFIWNWSLSACPALGVCWMKNLSRPLLLSWCCWPGAAHVNGPPGLARRQGETGQDGHGAGERARAPGKCKQVDTTIAFITGLPCPRAAHLAYIHSSNHVTLQVWKWTWQGHTVGPGHILSGGGRLCTQPVWFQSLCP